MAKGMSGNYFIRALDPGERFIWLLDRISCANFLVAAELAGQPLSDEALRRGLDELQRKHPLLSARVVEEPDGTVAFYREEGARIPLEVEERCEADWARPIEAELNAKFDDPGLPLARCQLLHLSDRSVVSMTFHHAIGDARSGVSLMKQLLRFCLRGVEPTVAGGVLPPMHSLFPPEFQWQDHPGKAEKLALRLKEEFLRHGAPAELPFLAHREPRREPRLRRIRLDADAGRRLQEHCRAEGTSVHGAVCAAHLIATRNLFDDEEARALYLMCPVDMRAHLVSDMGEQLSYCTSFLRSIYRVESRADLWPLAREVGADLKRRILRGDGHLSYAAMPLDEIGGSGPAFDAFAAGMEQLPAGSNISNVGRIRPLDDCPEVAAISFALCALPKHLASLNVTSYDDELTVNMTYDAAKLAPELADRLVTDLQTLLGEAAAVREAVAHKH
jgi:NRPS condensation-like uncharacterized protein